MFWNIKHIFLFSINENAKSLIDQHYFIFIETPIYCQLQIQIMVHYSLYFYWTLIAQ